jgi:hypothetical protein
MTAIIEHADAPVAVRLDGAVVVHLFYEPAVGRLGLRVPVGTIELQASPLTRVMIDRRTLNATDVVEISTVAPVLFPYFHGFAVSVADRVQLDGLDPNAAINECVFRWQDLLRQAGMLSLERQLGLIGELWLLDHLIGHLGPIEALESWSGPTHAAHDFRFGPFEIEVKTTRGEHRVHVISSDTQLVASEGSELHLLSLQFTAAGPGQGASLQTRIASVRARIQDAALKRTFDRTLADAFGLDLDDLAAYTARVKLRTPPYLVPVCGRFPRLVLGDLGDRTDTSRISDVRYRVDVEGLGFKAGSEQFTAVLGVINDVPG